MKINLLPETEKKEIAISVIQKKVLIILVFALIAELCFVAILFAVERYSVSFVGQAESDILLKETQLEEASMQSFKQTVSEANKRMEKIMGLWEGQSFITPVLEKFNVLTPSSIYFTGLSFTKEDEHSNIGITGFSATRGALFYFKQSLEQEESFKDVYFTPSSWVKPVEVNFSLTVQSIK